jgi:hypothetical protein
MAHELFHEFSRFTIELEMDVSIHNQEELARAFDMPSRAKNENTVHVAICPEPANLRLVWNQVSDTMRLSGR